jgi:hypothetical protein
MPMHHTGGMTHDAPRDLRVMADYGADPIWFDWGGENLNDLAISDRLRRDLPLPDHGWGPTFQRNGEASRQGAQPAEPL